MRTVLFIFLFSLSIISSGCFTYYPSRESPDSLKIESDRYSKILKFHLYDGKTLDVNEYDVKYYNKYKAIEKVFVYTEQDSVFKNGNLDSIKYTEKIIPADKIKSVTVERKKTDAKSATYTALIIVGSAVVLFCIIVAISLHNDNLHVKM
jgi:hypothetical protein